MHFVKAMIKAIITWCIVKDTFEISRDMCVFDIWTKAKCWWSKL